MRTALRRFMDRLRWLIGMIRQRKALERQFRSLLRDIKLELREWVGDDPALASTVLWDWYRGRSPGEVLGHGQVVMQRLAIAAEMAGHLDPGDWQVVESVRIAVQQAWQDLTDLRHGALSDMSAAPSAAMGELLHRVAARLVDARQRLAAVAPLSAFARSDEFGVAGHDGVPADRRTVGRPGVPRDLRDDAYGVRSRAATEPGAMAAPAVPFRVVFVANEATLFTVLDAGVEWQVGTVRLLGPGVAMVRRRRRRWLELPAERVPQSQAELDAFDADLLKVWWELGS